MRISGGDARGTKLKVPRGARPASERVRQAVFSSIASRVPGARVLDLYCGSGAYGLEALSRGAQEAVFVDSDPQATAACRDNAKAAGLSDWARVRRADVRRYVSGRATADGPFDLVFADPPYDRGAPPDALLSALGRLLNADGRIVLETRRASGPAPDPDGLAVEADRRYGDTRVLVFSRLGVP